jgi:hypothetical protein
MPMRYVSGIGTNLGLRITTAVYSLVITLGVMTTVGCVTEPWLAPTRQVAASLDPQYPLDSLKYYPIPSRDLGEEGTCLISVWVHPDGRCTPHKFARPAGSPHSTMPASQ